MCHVIEYWLAPPPFSCSQPSDVRLDPSMLEWFLTQGDSSSGKNDLFDFFLLHLLGLLVTAWFTPLDNGLATTKVWKRDKFVGCMVEVTSV